MSAKSLLAIVLFSFEVQLNNVVVFTPVTQFRQNTYDLDTGFLYT